MSQPAERREHNPDSQTSASGSKVAILGYGRFGLHFVKNKEQQEVDFLLSRDDCPILLVEAKLSNPEPGKVLRKHQEALGVPAVQLTNEGATYREYSNGDHRILSAPAWSWVSRLP